jgi:FkbM family methyltransferase
MTDLDTLDTTHDTEVAIIGMQGRFPQAKTLEQFWDNLQAGTECISFFSDQEEPHTNGDPASLAHSKRVKAAGVLSDIELFDATFFGISQREAELMDPQHRFFLECAWEALEGAGYNSETCTERIGVYAGVGINTYALFHLYSNLDLIRSAGMFQTMIVNDKDHLSTRVSHKLNLRGPSLTVQTACSTSLVAVHLACQSLLNGECDISLAGGVSINVRQKDGDIHQEGGIASPDGHCRAFDAKAQGTVFGSGVGIVVLKRLADAIRDGDYIHAVIKGSAINNDGAAKAGYTAPSEDGQAEVIADALAMARIEPETVRYIEAHGTGTPLGDPIEIAALSQAFGARTKQKGFCAIGSVKTNIGHVDTASGIAGLIKTVLSLKHKQIPPSLNFERPNPNIDFEQSAFYVNTRRMEWPADPFPRRAGVSSFGIGGTNAHVVLEEAPVIPASSAVQPWHLLLLSAKTQPALEMMTTNLIAYLKQHPEVNLSDMAYTLQVGRKSFSHCRAVVCRDVADALAALETRDSGRVLSSIRERHNRPVVFMFPGLGEQYPNMALELYQTEPTFKRHVDRCSTILEQHLGLDIRDVLYPAKDQTQNGDSEVRRSSDAASDGPDLRKILRREAPDVATQRLNQTMLAHPATFVIEYALARLLIAWGLRPQALIGHSLGEYVAACLAGVLSLEDALALVAQRARMIQESPGGAMLAVPFSEAEVQPFLTETLSLSAVNGPALCVLAGTTEAVATLESSLLSQGIACRRLQTSHAFHSKMMEPIAESFVELVKTIKLQPPTIPYISNVTGTWITPEQAIDPSYWARHLCEPVQFAKGVQELWQIGERVLLEVGPGQMLSTMAMQQPGSNGVSERVVLPTLRHIYDQRSDMAFLLSTIGELQLTGVTIDWAKRYAHERRHRIPLPTYPFDHQRYWIDMVTLQTRAVEQPQVAPLPEKTNAPADVTAARSHLRNDYAPPSNPTEERIAEIWQELLGNQQIGIHDNFFQLGGHSLLGAQLISRLHADFEIDVPLRALYEAPTIAGLSRAVEAILIAEIEHLTDEQAASEAPHLASEVTHLSIPKEFTLPNNLTILHMNPAETLHFYHDIFEDRVYTKHGITLHAGDCVFDVGANIGLFTLFVHSTYHDVRVYAFEPAAPMFDLLRSNTSPYQARTQLFNYGLSDKEAEATFTFYPLSTGMSSFYGDEAEEKAVFKQLIANQHQHAAAGMEPLTNYFDELVDLRFTSETLTCKLRPLSDVIAETGVERIDLLKVDVQKSELDVLRGINEADWSKIRQIVLEVHDLDGRLEYMTNLLKQRGYQIVVDQDNLYAASAMYNVYAIRR